VYPRILIPLLLLLFFHENIYSQICTTLGQTPATAFPVCGTDVFTQTTVPICRTNKIPTKCVDSNFIGDKNPYWYKFTCYVSGTLGFVITPNTITDDYDWQIFDITGRNPNDVYINNPALTISYNWSGNSGLTGAKAGSGSGLYNCAGPAYPTFNDMATLIQGHTYLLLVSHFDDSQSGYQLSFGGGTAALVDTVQPRFKSVSINCDGSMISLKLNKKLKCSSIASDGSDFMISPSGTIASVAGIDCSSSFDVDSIVIKLSAPLPPGNYTLTAQNGTDGNTLLDNCNVMLAVGEKLNFTLAALQPTPMDSISPVKCKPSSLRLVFKKPMQCNSIAADGSDFTVTGPSAVSVISANGTCNNGVTTTIDVQLASAIKVGGMYQVNLKTGSDGNTLIDECGQQSLAASLAFTGYDTASAFFTYQVNVGCHFDTLSFSGPAANGVNQWSWSVNGNKFSTQQNPVRILPASGQFTIVLSASNGVCTDSSSTTIVLDDEVKARFQTTNTICPEDSAFFTNTSTGKINSWLWDLGNGVTSIQPTPAPQTYPKTGVETHYIALLTVVGENGCIDTTRQTIRVLKSCFIGVPNAFTPNNDGINDFYYPINAFKADDLDFRVYNRWGQVVFKSNDWTKKWDGKIKGIPQPPGVYVWTFRYIHRDTGKKYSLKGNVMLIR